jgi:hypothetical protein
VRAVYESSTLIMFGSVKQIQIRIRLEYDIIVVAISLIIIVIIVNDYTLYHLFYD